jgi:hypothetical protein
MPILPLALPHYRRIPICTIRGIAHSRSRIDCGGNGVSRDMGRSHCLSCGPCRRSGCVIFCLPGRCMGSKGGSPHDPHIEDAGAHPFPARPDRPSRAIVLGEPVLEIRQRTFGTVRGPHGRRPVVGLLHKPCNPPVKIRNGHFAFFHFFPVIVDAIDSCQYGAIVKRLCSRRNPGFSRLCSAAESFAFLCRGARRKTPPPLRVALCRRTH